MDIWVVAAAAGAGCVAKYWQNLLKEKEGVFESFQGNLIIEKSRSSAGNQPINQQLVDHERSVGCHPSSFLHKKIRRQADEEAASEGEDISSGLDERLADTLRLDVPHSLENEIASTSQADSFITSNSGKREGNNVFYFSSSRSPFIRKCSHQDGGDNNNDKCNYEQSDREHLSQPNLYHQKIGTGSVFRSGRNSRNRKWSHGYTVKPQNSLESCLVAQMYKEHFEMEEYVFSSLPSPTTPIMRPFVITDGSQIISKASCVGGQFENGQHKFLTKDEEDAQRNGIRNGALPLPHLGLIQLPRRPKRGSKIIPRTHQSHKRLQSQGLHEGVLLFCLGVSIGVMSTLRSSKREVDELNNLLRQSQNLVQDLHEELEMKESVTVKELLNESIGHVETKESIDAFAYQPQRGFSPNESNHTEDKEAYTQEERDKLELMSRIEAELEAELERLELNMNASSLQRRLSDLGEIDPDLEAEVVQGELRPDRIVVGADDSENDTGGSSTTRTHPANYAVSPKELSLRLHEVIQSRLEERILELESALQDSQKRLRYMEAQRDFSNSDYGSLSTHESPTKMENVHAVSSPIYLNLADDALNAYNEAYTEFSKEESFPSKTSGTKQINDGISLLNQFSYSDWISNENGHLLNLETDGTKSSEAEEKVDDDYEDELGMLLIKQIVEKTKQGSPVVLNAQRILFAMDDD